jgi:integrase
MSRTRENTAKNNLWFLERFMKWLRQGSSKFAGFSPDELIQYQKKAGNGEKYEVLDVIQAWVNSLNGRAGYKRRCYAALKSFFLHSRAELPRDPSFNVRGDEPRVVGTLTPEEIREMVLSSNPCYQAVILCIFQAGMDRGSFLWWNSHGWPKLKEDLRNDPDVIRIDLPGRKKARFEKPYYSFIGRDAIEAVKKWVLHRPESAGAIFTDQFDKPITANAIKTHWLRHGDKIGLFSRPGNRDSGNRYGKNVHEMRDVFRTLWQKSPAKPSVAEFCMGHVVDPLEYDKSYTDEKWVRKEYLKALPWLNILSSGRPYGQVAEDEVESLRSHVQQLQAQTERARKLDMLLEDPEVYEAFVKTLRGLKEKKVSS